MGSTVLPDVDCVGETCDWLVPVWDGVVMLGPLGLTGEVGVTGFGLLLGRLGWVLFSSVDGLTLATLTST